MNRLAALASFGLAIAMSIFAGVLLSAVGDRPPEFAKDAAAYLPWLNRNGSTFLWTHILIVSVIALFLVTVPPALYNAFKPIDSGWALTALVAALFGFGLFAVLSIVDGWASPVLGRMYVSSSGDLKESIASLWRWLDAWRDEGFKTVAYFLMAIFLGANGMLMRRAAKSPIEGSGSAPWRGLGAFSLIYAASMGLMSALNVVASLTGSPMADDGILGLVNLILLLVAWGVWNGLILWRHNA
ncbi:MAG: hypothetical protein ACRDGG_09420 [Anaerolineae bacterium]